MPRNTNPRTRPEKETRFTLVNVLKFTALAVGVAGLIVGTILIRGEGRTGLGVELIVAGLFGALLWLAVARVVERLDQMAEALERIAGEQEK